MKKVILALILLWIATATFAQEKSSHEVYSLMVFNFSRYVEWPDQAEEGDFIIGVIGDDQVFNTLKQWYDGKPKGTKKYIIKKLTSPAECSACQVVYVAARESKAFDYIRKASAGKPILTITDSNGLGHKGSCINFKTVDGKLRFELNEAIVRQAGLKVSSSLVRMAILI